MHPTAPLQVSQFQIEHLVEHGEAHHAEHVLSFVIEGELQMRHGEPLTVRAGSVVIIPAGVPHQLLSGQSLHIWHLSFCPSCLNLSENLTPMRPFFQVRLGALPVVGIPADRQGLLIQYFIELQRLSRTAHLANFELCKSLMQLILAEVAAAMVPASSTGDPLINAVLDYIQTHCHASLSLQQVAAAVHKSPAHLTHRVKLATGFSVGEWIISNRLHQACTRLLHSRASVAAIAEQVGWQDVTHFIRLFKKRFGLTPGAWRKQQLGHATAPS
jgi:AraC-like DNA-binding protein